MPRFSRDPGRRTAPAEAFDVFCAIDERAPLDGFSTSVLMTALDTARDAGLAHAAAQVAFELGLRVGRANERA